MPMPSLVRVLSNPQGTCARKRCTAGGTHMIFVEKPVLVLCEQDWRVFVKELMRSEHSSVPVKDWLDSPFDGEAQLNG